jgi:hypothetical protein
MEPRARAAPGSAIRSKGTGMLDTFTLLRFLHFVERETLRGWERDH